MIQKLRSNLRWQTQVLFPHLTLPGRGVIILSWRAVVGTVNGIAILELGSRNLLHSTCKYGLIVQCLPDIQGISHSTSVH